MKRRDQSRELIKDSVHKIAKNSSVPLYRQLEEMQGRRIKNGELKPGDQLQAFEE